MWEGDEPSTAREIWAQRIDAATGAEVGTNDFRISAMGAPASDADARFNAFAPDVVWNADRDMYLVVWRGDTDAGGLVDNETEIYGQRLTVAGAEIGADDFRVSTMGPDGSALFQALDPVLAYNSVALEYLVAWAGSDDTGSLVAGEREIYGQRLRGGSAAEIGADDERLSDMGDTDGSTAQRAERPAVAAGGPVVQTLAAWQGDDDTGALADDEFEIYGQFAFLAVPVEISEFSVD